MSVIHVKPCDTLCIITTAIKTSQHGACKAQIQIKTPNGEIELSMDDIAHLNAVFNALNELLNDVNDNTLDIDQIRSRVFHSNQTPPIVRKPLFDLPLEKHTLPHSQPLEPAT